jgi:hypothetical protein
MSNLLFHQGPFCLSAISSGIQQHLSLKATRIKDGQLCTKAEVLIETDVKCIISRKVMRYLGGGAYP